VADKFLCIIFRATALLLRYQYLLSFSYLVLLIHNVTLPDTHHSAATQFGGVTDQSDTDKAWADEIHRQELNAYRSTLEALHASGPLTWEKETMVTDLRFTETPVGLPYPFGNAVGMDTPPIRPRNVSLVLETFPMPFPRRFLSVSGRFLSLEQI
ncbi:EMSY domain-containing protein, partial [Tanacetum coccineum]